MSNNEILLKIEALNKLGLITDEEAKRFISEFKKSGPDGLQLYLAEYAKSEEIERQKQESDLEKETRALVREDKALLQKWRKVAQRDLKKRSKGRVDDYLKFQKKNELMRKKLELEMAAADRKIDEIVAEAAQSIEAEILKKIREKIA